MPIKSSKFELHTVANTQYVVKPVKGKTNKQLRAEAHNAKAMAEYTRLLKCAEARAATTGIVDTIADPQLMNAVAPITLVRVTSTRVRTRKKEWGDYGYASKEGLRNFIQMATEQTTIDHALAKLVA